MLHPREGSKRTVAIPVGDKIGAVESKWKMRQILNEYGNLKILHSTVAKKFRLKVPYKNENGHIPSLLVFIGLKNIF